MELNSGLTLSTDLVLGLVLGLGVTGWGAVECSIWGLHHSAGGLHCSHGQQQRELKGCDWERWPTQSETEGCCVNWTHANQSLSIANTMFDMWCVDNVVLLGASGPQACIGAVFG